MPWPDDPLVAAPSGGCGADLVIEATGSAEGLATALDLVRPRGGKFVLECG